MLQSRGRKSSAFNLCRQCPEGCLGRQILRTRFGFQWFQFRCDRTKRRLFEWNGEHPILVLASKGLGACPGPLTGCYLKEADTKCTPTKNDEPVATGQEHFPGPEITGGRPVGKEAKRTPERHFRGGFSKIGPLLAELPFQFAHLWMQPGFFFSAAGPATARARR